MVKGEKKTELERLLYSLHFPPSSEKEERGTESSKAEEKRGEKRHVALYPFSFSVAKEGAGSEM